MNTTVSSAPNHLNMKHKQCQIIYQTRETVLHRDIQTPRRELKIRRPAFLTYMYMLKRNLGKEKLSCYPQILSLFPVKSWRRTCDRGLNSEPNQMHSKYGDANKYWYLLETSPEENRTVTFICWTHPTSERLRTMDDPSSHVITPAKITHPTLVVHEISFLSVLLWNKKTAKSTRNFCGIVSLHVCDKSVKSCQRLGLLDTFWVCTLVNCISTSKQTYNCYTYLLLSICPVTVPLSALIAM